MSLITGSVGLIFQKQLEGAKPSQNIDFNDDTFSKILEKQINNQDTNMNTASGINIGDFDHTKSVHGTNGENLSLSKTNSGNFDFNKDMTMSEIITFFPSIFSSKPDLMSNENNKVFEFERKIAANSYGKYARDFVTDLTDFVTDTRKLKS